MNDNLKYYILYAILYGIILLLGEGMYRYLRFNEAHTRNFSHFSAGLLSLPYPWLFSSHWWVLLLSVQSSAVLLLTRSAGFFPSHHKAANDSLGSPLFFASLYLCYLVFRLTDNTAFFLLPILILTISDMTASLVGRNYGNPSGERSRIWPIKGKTLAGSIAFFLTALIISSFFYHRKMGMNIGSALAMGAGIAFATTIGEAWSVNGFDNLFIPVITLIIMCLYAFF